MTAAQSWEIKNIRYEIYQLSGKNQRGECVWYVVPDIVRRVLRGNAGLDDQGGQGDDQGDQPDTAGLTLLSNPKKSFVCFGNIRGCIFF
jgi:hypothetical protein